jgi:hypothetical protein
MSIQVAQQDGEVVVVNGTQGTVIIEGDNPREVTSAEARTLALTTAKRYLSKPGISTQGGPYPVDPEGEPIRDLMRGIPPGSRYRQDFVVQEGM